LHVVVGVVGSEYKEGGEPYDEGKKRNFKGGVRK